MEVSVRVAAQSEQALQAVAGTGLLQILVSTALQLYGQQQGLQVEALQKDDLLLHLTTLELLSTLAVAPHGHKWLESNGVLPSLAAMLQDSSDLLLPGLVQFWGGLAHRQVTITTAVCCSTSNVLCSPAWWWRATPPCWPPWSASSGGTTRPARPRRSVTRWQSNTSSQMFFPAETVGFIGSSLEGKAVLAERTAVVRECLSKLGQLLQVENCVE